MDVREIEIVQATFAKVAPQAEQTAAAFYARLFEIAPDVKPMFKGDIKQQGQKLMGTLTVVVNGLSDLDAILPVARQLGTKHVGYGVLAAHYDKVGAALLGTLADEFGDEWSPETEAAWTNAYTTLAGVMMAASEASGGATA